MLQIPLSQGLIAAAVFIAFVAASIWIAHRRGWNEGYDSAISQHEDAR